MISKSSESKKIRIRESGESLIGVMMGIVVAMIVIGGLVSFLSDQTKSDKSTTKGIEAAKVYDVIMHKADCCQTLAHLQPVTNRACTDINGTTVGLIIKTRQGTPLTEADFKLTNDTKAKFLCVDNGGLTKRLQLQINTKDMNGAWKSNFVDASKDTPFCVKELLDSTACSNSLMGADTWLAGSVTEGAPLAFTPPSSNPPPNILPVGESIDPSLKPYLPAAPTVQPSCATPVTVVCGAQGKINLCDLCSTLN